LKKIREKKKKYISFLFFFFFKQSINTKKREKTQKNIKNQYQKREIKIKKSRKTDFIIIRERKIK